MSPISPDNLGTVALAVGALGASSYAIVDGLKLFSWIDLAGFERLFHQGGRRLTQKHAANLDPLLPALKIAYGTAVMEVLKAQYRGGRTGDLPRTLRQGVRIGLGMMEKAQVEKLATDLGLGEATVQLVVGALEKARQLRPPATGQGDAKPQVPPMGDDERASLARLETTLDARIDAALVLANAQYATQTKLYAMVVALAIAFGVGAAVLESEHKYAICLLVGIAAVPLAPVAKDLASGLQAAVKAFRGK